MTKQRIIGAILLIASLTLYYLDLLQFQWLGFFLGIMAAIGTGLLFGFFKRR